MNLWNRSRFNHRPAFATALFLLVTFDNGLCLRAADSEEARLPLSGIVQDHLGQPLPNATVFIYTAGPRKGPGILCPSCYADCRKRTTTGGDGKFRIESLDPDLVFRVLVAAPGRQPEFVPGVKPESGPLSVTLQPIRGGETPERRLQGRLTDPEGKPVAGAVINLRSVTRGERTQYGGNTNIDPVAVSDSSGNFVLRGREDFQAAGIDVEARGLAKKIVSRLATGDKVHPLKLAEGVTIQGRLLKDGRPFPGIELGVAGADRNSEIFVGDFTVATDAQGRFVLSNLPARTDYFFYGLMESLGSEGAIVVKRVRTAEDGSTLDLGDVQVTRAFTVEGVIRLTDGSAPPTNTPVMLSRDDAWDTARTVVDAKGRFRFNGVPAGTVNLSARITDHRLTLRNRSLDPLNPYHLTGRVSGDKKDLVLEFEKGARHENLGSNPGLLAEEPLRGAESLPNSPDAGDIRVTGTVVDATTGEPLKTFSVVEGRHTQFNDQIEWVNTRRSEHQNGRFEVSMTKQQRAPAVMVEAEGYIPQSSGVIGTNGTNVTFALKKGSGPSGVVLKPDGSPAAETTIYLADMRNGIYVGENNLSVRESVYRDTRSTRTDAQGRFSFLPQIDAYAVVVLTQDGYAERRVGELETNAILRLEKFGRIEGKLMIGTRPGTNESIRLGLAHIPYVYHPRSFPPISLFLTTRTDDEGRFVFERVPPLAVEVYHEPKVRDSRMGTIPQAQTTKFAVQPGKTNHLALGGTGRPVTGKVVVSGYEGELNFRADVQSLEKIPPQPPELPDLIALSREFAAKIRGMTNDTEKAAAQEQFGKARTEGLEKTRMFYRSEAGRKYHFASRRDALNFQPDGSFRIEDIPGGKYRLKLEFREGGGDSHSRFSAPVVATLHREIEVPESPGGRSDEPFDLGTIEIQARTVLGMGKPAPDFETRTLENQPLKLSEFKGKFVLVDFWAVWCGPCIAETPHLTAAWEKFKDNPRFAMIGLSLDPDVSAPRRYTTENKMGWIQGFLGDWSNTEIPNRFGVQGIPSIFLIGPDGTVVAKDLRGDAIQAAIAAALKK